MLHAARDGLDRVGRIHRIMRGLVRIDEGRKHIQPIALSSTRIFAPQSRSISFEGRLVVVRAGFISVAAMLNLVHIDSVVVPGHADRFDPHDVLLEIAGNDQPIVILLDVEHDPIGRDNAGGSKTAPYIRCARPPRLHHASRAAFSAGWSLYPRRLSAELSQRAPSNEPCAQNRGPPTGARSQAVAVLSIRTRIGIASS
jgi:hypothetical protein